MAISGISSSTNYLATTRSVAQPGANASPPIDPQNKPAVAATEQTDRTTDATTKLNDSELELVSKLQATDRHVRAHEQAHLSASGGLATSGPTYVYQKGPDGVSYAVGGEVSIDTSPGKTAEETIERAKTIEAAALAPSDPSSQDRAVAAQAEEMERDARAKLALQDAADVEHPEDRQKARINKAYGATPKSEGGSDKVNTYA